MSINYQFFRDKLYNCTNKVFDLVATIDHPYASPPVRLIDGHYKLNMLTKQGLRPYICIWDVINPNVNSYRYELSIDVGIFNTRDKSFFIFDDRTLYPLQKPRLIDFMEIKKRVRLILLRLGISDINLKNFLDNFKIIINIYRRNIKKSTNGTNFYQNLLSDLYRTLKFEDLAEFINKFSESYFFSSFITEWIPFCIQKTRGEIFGISALQKKGLFRKSCFRFISDSEKTINIDIEDNLAWIISALRNRRIIPSYEVFFWTLALANIKHFGNDYGFFERLNQILPFFSNQIQLTQHNQDSSYIIQFEKDRSFNYFQEKDHYIVKKNNSMKISRISSITALFCHAGVSLGNILRDIFEGVIQSPVIIKMGEVYKYENKNTE